MLSRSVSKISLSVKSNGLKFMSTAAKLPDLPYDFGALEPVISAEIMQIHHSKHHNAYVTNLNLAMTKLEEATAKGDTSSIIALQQAIKFNGGGHLNHSIFWKNLAPVGKGGGEMPAGDLIKSIESQYGSLDKLQETMSAASAGVQGSVRNENIDHFQPIQIQPSLILYLIFADFTFRDGVGWVSIKHPRSLLSPLAQIKIRYLLLQDSSRF